MPAGSIAKSIICALIVGLLALSAAEAAAHPMNKVRAGELVIDLPPNVTDGYSGKAPDLGALELGAPLPHYGPRS